MFGSLSSQESGSFLITNFHELMKSLFLQETNKAIEILKNKTLDIYDYDNQLFRELVVHRLTIEETNQILRIINQLLNRNIILNCSTRCWKLVDQSDSTWNYDERPREPLIINQKLYKRQRI